MNNMKNTNQLENQLSDCLGNLRIITSGFHGISKTMQDGRRASADALERFNLNASKDRRESVKERLRLAFKERNSGKTFKQLGEILGVSSGRAMQLFKRACRVNDLGRLFG
jgi:hypothetical protein